MKTKKKIWILCLLFLCGLQAMQAQGTQRASDYMEAPATVKQYCEATFVLHHVPTGGDVDVITWVLPWDNIIEVASKSYNENGYAVDARTFIFTAPGTYKIGAGGASKTISVISNPLSLSAPTTVCPWGTQLNLSEISSYLTREFEVSGGGGSLAITKDGLLTYDDLFEGTCSVSYSVKYGGVVQDRLAQAVSMRLKPHVLTGKYYLSDDGSPSGKEYVLRISSNFIPLEKEVIAYVDLSGAKLKKFNLIPSSYNQVTIYEINLLSGRIRFKVTKGANVSFEYALEYACHVKEGRCDFTIRGNNSTYLVSAPAGSGIIRIGKENEAIGKSTRMADQYDILNALTGSVLLKGRLAESENEVDASALPRGIYIVRIYTSEGIQTHKISIEK